MTWIRQASSIGTCSDWSCLNASREGISSGVAGGACCCCFCPNSATCLTRICPGMARGCRSRRVRRARFRYPALAAASRATRRGDRASGPVATGRSIGLLSRPGGKQPGSGQSAYLGPVRTGNVGYRFGPTLHRTGQTLTDYLSATSAPTWAPDRSVYSEMRF